MGPSGGGGVKLQIIYDSAKQLVGYYMNIPTYNQSSVNCELSTRHIGQW